MTKPTPSVSAGALALLVSLATTAPTLAGEADVIAATASQNAAGTWTVSATILHADTGWEHYADRFDVLAPDGTVLAERVLLHPHVNEQPFTRSGGPVDIQSRERVIVRAHMNRAGYGGEAFVGSVESGFVESDTADGVAPGLAEEPPLPDGCAF